jgi:putative mRNA 3-end processing factor
MLDHLILSRGVLRLREFGLSLDPTTPSALAFVSHAHQDHWANHARTLCTPETASLLAQQECQTAIQPLPFHRPIVMGKYRLELVPAGHISGAAQLVVDADEHTTVYTGDLGPLAGLPVAGAPEIRTCDELVIDATYGHPRHVYPAPVDALAQLVDAVAAARAAGLVPVVIGNALGRLQEAAQALITAGQPLAATPTVIAITRACGPAGAELARQMRPFRGTPPADAVCLYSMRARARTADWRRVHRIALTGMTSPGAAGTLGVEQCIPLVDHADFDDLLAYVRRCGARRVWTAFTHAGPLAQALCDEGIDARPLQEDPQLTLF